MRTQLALLLAVAACTPKTTTETPEEATVAAYEPGTKREAPAPLESKPFKAPATETRTLSNGMSVVVARNAEVPLVYVTVAFRVGPWMDPEGREGLADVTFDMLNEGAGDKSAEQISRELKKMASDLGTSASADGATVSMSTLKANLEPTLDLMALVTTKPTFPDAEWQLILPRRVAGVQAARKDPNKIASRIDEIPFYGSAYRGRVSTEAAYQAIDTKQMRAFYESWVGPKNGIILVGGDVTADEIVPMLEARLGSWKPEVETPELPADPTVPDAAKVYLVDKPGAAQSVVRAMTVLGNPTDEDHFAMRMGIDVVGGTFMSRLNMNLREDKGYTYGARCWNAARYGTELGFCNASVRTDATGPSLVEMRKELTEVRTDRKITQQDLDYMKGTRINGYPQKFETSGALLGEQAQIWRYGLPADWPERYLPGIEAVTVEQAQQALEARWDLDRTVWVVVGDKSVIQKDLESFGLPIVELDADGKPL